MFKHRATKIYPKIKTKNIKCFRCCFYYVYKTYFIPFCWFFHALLHINMGFFKSTQQNNFTFPMWIFDALQTNCFNSILIND